MIAPKRSHSGVSGLTPSLVAARRAGRRNDTGISSHGQASDPSGDAGVLQAQLAATQALLKAESGPEVRTIVWTLVHALGGKMTPARGADPATVLPIDLSLGLAEPMLPLAAPASEAEVRIREVLPGFLDSARLVLSRIHATNRRDKEASRDQLTGLLTRRAWMRRLAAAVPGDSVCLIDLDHFKAVNDTGGHAAGDALLRAIGQVVLGAFRTGDSCGRYGGDELVCLTQAFSAQDLFRRCEDLRQTWEAGRPPAGADVGLSIGVAEVRESGGLTALQAADAAMYRAKGAGRNQTVLASNGDYHAWSD